MKKNFKTGIIAGILIGVLVTAGIGSTAFFVTDGFTNPSMDKARINLTSINKKVRTLETLIEAIGLPKCKVCTHCFDGSSHF